MNRLLAVCLIGLLAWPVDPAGATHKPVDSKPLDILELTPRMARFLVRHVSPRQNPSDQVTALMDALFGRKGLSITYDSNATLTAAETFESGRGNCLSFTILFVALARHIGLDAYFEEVGEVISWDRRGNVVVRNQHMIVEIEVENGRQQVDFLPEARQRYRAVRRISDQRALAHYYNNLGVDALAAGDVDGSLALLDQALAADGELSYAWTNKGVALRQQGDFEGAEASHLRALEIDRSESAARTNLASLYLAIGQQDKAKPLLRRVKDDLDRNPFHHFRKGLTHARAGETPQALRHLREAIRRMPDEPEFHIALADALSDAGEPAKAVESLQRALELTEDEAARSELQQEIEDLVGSRS
ncbi:MAG: tetratricopeptide repeat protein [Acidobacteriota bacterium]